MVTIGMQNHLVNHFSTINYLQVYLQSVLVFYMLDTFAVIIQNFLSNVVSYLVQRFNSLFLGNCSFQ